MSCRDFSLFSNLMIDCLLLFEGQDGKFRANRLVTSASFAQSLLSQSPITMASQPDSSAQDHSLDAILAKMAPKYTRDGHDALFLVLHAFMVSAGFRLVGLGDDGSIISMYSLYLSPILIQLIY